MTSATELEEIISYFEQNPGELEAGATSLQRIDTHISTVLLSRQYVYKFKKPVDFGFISQVTLEQRLFNCQQEVKLNRRLAPEVYLAVGGITKQQGRFTLCEVSHTQALEYFVKMKRLDDKQNLLHQVRHKSLTEPELDSLAFVLAEFHATCQCGEEINQRYHFHQNLKDNLKNLQQAQVEPTLLREIENLYQINRPALEQRLLQKKIVNGHGDLRLDHIYYNGNQFEIIDCIEFNDSLRTVDPLEDIAFLTLGLRIEGRGDLADFFIAAYFSYSLDVRPGLMKLFEIYRATVRAKVDYLSLPSANKTGKAYLSKRFRAYIQLVQDLIRQKKQSAIKKVHLVMGLPLSGKSTKARQLQQQLHLPIVATDVVRKRLANDSLLADRQVDFGKGIYSDLAKKRVYTRSLALAHLYLNQFGGVILDGTYGNLKDQTRARKFAARNGAQFEVTFCQVAESTVQERITKRKQSGSVSDLKDFATWQKLKENFHIPPEAANRHG